MLLLATQPWIKTWVALGQSADMQVRWEAAFKGGTHNVLVGHCQFQPLSHRPYSFQVSKRDNQRYAACSTAFTCHDVLQHRIVSCCCTVRAVLVHVQHMICLSNLAGPGHTHICILFLVKPVQCFVVIPVQSSGCIDHIPHSCSCNAVSIT